MYVEYKKMVKIILFVKQKLRHRRRELRYGYQRVREGSG